MKCTCCVSQRIKTEPAGLSGYYSCEECGCSFKGSGEQSRDTVTNHYRSMDPYSQVGHAKLHFFHAVLDYLSLHGTKEGRLLLEVGCGYGYFLALAAARGWQCFGKELVHPAVLIAREEVGEQRIFHGPLREAQYQDNFFDAVALWDVLAVVEQPFEELEHCFRLLQRGGVLGIRTWNVHGKKLLYRFSLFFGPIITRLNIKKAYAFNRYCFSRKGLSALLQRTGFTRIQITSSPLIKGDPYEHCAVNVPLWEAKGCIDLVSRSIFRMTAGRVLISPSLLVWAEKP